MYTRILLVPAFALTLTCASPAFATDDETGQTPPAAVPAAQKECIKEESGYREEGGRFAYVTTLTNACETRVSCTIHASVMQAKGAFSGHKTLVLAPSSKGDAARKSYALKVAMAGGIAQSSRQCKVL